MFLQASLGMRRSRGEEEEEEEEEEGR